MQTSKGSDVFKKISSEYGIYFAFLVLIVVLSILSPAFFSLSNLLNVLKQSSVTGIIAIGTTFVILTGGIDLSSGSLVALCGVLAALFAGPQGLGSAGLGFIRFEEGMEQALKQVDRALPIIVPVLVAIGSGAFIGFFNGIVVSRGKVPPFIVTLGTMTMARGAALIAADGGTVPYVTEKFKALGGSVVFGIPSLVYFFAAVFFIFAFILYKTKFGRHVYAIGGNEVASHVSGLNVKRTKTLVYVIAGALSGLAGILLASRIAVGSPVSGEGYELDAIAAVVIGGTSLSGGIGKLTGTLIGVLIIAVMSNGLDMLNVSSYYQQIVKGGIIILAVLWDMRSKQTV